MSAPLPDTFPKGMRVLCCDKDPLGLMLMRRMLAICEYEVSVCNKPEDALNLLRTSAFHLVILDVQPRDNDSFKLLETISLEMEMPVVLVSSTDNRELVLRGVEFGAVDFLVKPVQIPQLKNIWQHVMRKNRRRSSLQSGGGDDSGRPSSPGHTSMSGQSANAGAPGGFMERISDTCRQFGDIHDQAPARADGGVATGLQAATSSGQNSDEPNQRRPRFVWTAELHRDFVTAVNRLGVDQAGPRRILELMNVPGITRENISSHLQKYRAYLRRVQAQQAQQQATNPQLLGRGPPPYGPGMPYPTGTGPDERPYPQDMQAHAASLGPAGQMTFAPGQMGPGAPYGQQHARPDRPRRHSVGALPFGAERSVSGTDSGEAFDESEEGASGGRRKKRGRLSQCSVPGSAADMSSWPPETAHAAQDYSTQQQPHGSSGDLKRMWNSFHISSQQQQQQPGGMLAMPRQYTAGQFAPGQEQDAAAAAAAAVAAGSQFWAQQQQQQQHHHHHHQQQMLLQQQQHQQYFQQKQQQLYQHLQQQQQQHAGAAAKHAAAAALKWDPPIPDAVPSLAYFSSPSDTGMPMSSDSHHRLSETLSSLQRVSSSGWGALTAQAGFDSGQQQQQVTQAQIRALGLPRKEDSGRTLEWALGPGGAAALGERPPSLGPLLEHNPNQGAIANDWGLLPAMGVPGSATTAAAAAVAAAAAPPRAQSPPPLAPVPVLAPEGATWVESDPLMRLLMMEGEGGNGMDVEDMIRDLGGAAI